MSAVTEFPIERTRPSNQPFLIWLERDADDPLLYRVCWTDEGKSGFDPVDHSVPFDVAAHMAARIARERRRCVPVDAAVQSLVAARCA